MGKVLELYKFEDHIRECNKRYGDLEKKIDAVDQRLSRMERLLIEIKYAIQGEVYDPD